MWDGRLSLGYLVRWQVLQGWTPSKALPAVVHASSCNPVGFAVSVGILNVVF